MSGRTVRLIAVAFALGASPAFAAGKCSRTMIA